jgi:hypothetical protein
MTHQFDRVGNYNVTVSVTDSGNGKIGRTASDNIIIRVSDNEPPIISGPSYIIAEATDPQGANVTYTVSATDIVDGAVPVECNPPSGSMFPIETTTVNCRASDSSDNQANGTFDVTVQQGGDSQSQDITPPVIQATIDGTEGSNGWYVSDVDVSWIVTDPESQLTFRSEACDLTTTITEDTIVEGQIVTCEATSDGGNATESITIKRDATNPNIDWSSEISDGDEVEEGQVPSEPTCDASDTQSGMDGECEVTGYSTEVGEHTITIAATDIAGNEVTETISSTVIEGDIVEEFEDEDVEFAA